MWAEDLDIDFADIPVFSEGQMKAALEEARFNMLLNAAINVWNSNKENEMRREAIDRLTEKWVDPHLIELAFKFGFTGDTMVRMDDEYIQKLIDAHQTLQSKTHEFTCTDGPFRKRHQIEPWAFKEFRSIIEMLGMQLSWTCN